MKEVTKYTTISGSSKNIQEFVNLINQYIEKGWSPQGGISTVTLSNSFGVIMFYQAMVMYKQENKI